MIMIGSPTHDDVDKRSTFRNLLRVLLHPTGFLVLWSLALVTLVSLSIIYLLKCLFYFKNVKSRILASCRCQLFLRSLDFMSSFASIRTVFHSEICLLPNSMVGFHCPSFSTPCQNLRAVVYKRKKVSINSCQSDEQVISHRKFGWRTSYGKYGVKRERCVLVFAWDGALFGAFRDTLSAIIG
ncbi:hypothetical protein Dsin_003599 [Dipteronia sinensis]|uniref:Uncharacterized protein n=1 Tax=Dipteronia sinensis TaxID=43782 RepID=A0AAE0B808_9ROSI|nr:hypothetical protein Dsin_003599 [Dipteronia sinensis]